MELHINYFPGLYTLALLELFGFIGVEHGQPEAGKAWRIARVRRTPFGDAMIRLLSGFLLSEEFLEKFDEEEEEDVPVGELQPRVQPFFPEWRRNLELPEIGFQSGTHIFKVSLGKQVWRRIAVSGEDYFESLSDAILEAFEFDHDHLYQFSYKNRFGVLVDISHPFLEEPPFTTEVRIGEVGIKPGAPMAYLYDFGDYWVFNLDLESIDPAGPRTRRPKILEAHGEAPQQYPGLDDEWDDDEEDGDEEWEEPEELDE